MKAIHNCKYLDEVKELVVLYPKDTEKWKQFTTNSETVSTSNKLFCIPKILKNESNSQHIYRPILKKRCCFVSQRYWKMKAIHNKSVSHYAWNLVVLYPKDTEKWKQFTTCEYRAQLEARLFCIPKILKNESNSQRRIYQSFVDIRCFVSQRYWKMRAIHNQCQKV